MNRPEAYPRIFATGRRMAALCIFTGASAFALAVSAQTGATAAPTEFIHGEWVGRCEPYGSTPAADCAIIGDVIPEHLKEMERIKAWMEPMRSWPEGPLLKPDTKTGKFYIQYVDYERSTLKGVANIIGGHNPTSGHITFTQREVAEAASEAGAKSLAQFSAHEMFHAYQAGSPFTVSLNLSGRSVEDMSVAWIREGTAEAVGYLYQKQRYGTAQPPRLTSYARPLNRTDDKGYDRGEFWLHLADLFNASSPAKFLFDLHKSAKRISKEDYAGSIAWLDDELKSKGKGLRESYGLIIGQIENQDHYIPDNVKVFSFPEVEANSPNSAIEVRSEALPIRELAATGFLAVIRGKDLPPPEDQDLPGKKLVWLEMLVDKKSSPERVGLAVSGQWVDRKPFTRLLLPEGRDLGFFGRLTNVDGPKPATTKATKSAVNIITRFVHLQPLGCVRTGLPYDIDVRYANNPLGSAPELNFKAKRGSFSGATYTAPASPGAEELIVQARASGRDVWVPFAKFAVKQRCNLTIIHPDGARITYDDNTHASRYENPHGEPPGYADAKGLVAYDADTGRWGRIPYEQMFGINIDPAMMEAMNEALAKGMAEAGVKNLPGGMQGDMGGAMPQGMPGGMPDIFGGGNTSFMTQPVTKDGRRLHGIYQAPLLLVESIKLMRRDARQNKTGQESAAPCPKGGGTCIRLIMKSEPGNQIFFDKSGEPVAFGQQGNMAYIEYSGDPVIVPPA